MYFIKIQFAFLLLILSKTCQPSEYCENPGPREEETNSLPILPPIKVGEKTYYVQTFIMANWYRALQFCKFQGMELASINNQEENDKLLGALQATYGLSLRFWTSGNDLAVNGTYFWLSTGANFQFEHWKPGEPSHQSPGGQEEHCVEIVRSSASINETLIWNDRQCALEDYVICEV